MQSLMGNYHYNAYTVIRIGLPLPLPLNRKHLLQKKYKTVKMRTVQLNTNNNNKTNNQTTE